MLEYTTKDGLNASKNGPALTWFNGLSPDLSWTTVKRLFTDKYVQIGWQHPSVVVESETFHNMQLGSTQEIKDFFFCQVQEKGQILSKPDHEIMFRFINGLPEKLAFYVRTSHPKTESEALSFAKAGEAYKYRIHEQCAAVGKGPAFRNTQYSEEISEMKSQISGLTSMMKRMTPDKTFQQSDQRQSSGCFNCSCTGHTKRYCNWNGSGTISGDISCQLCNQSGHGAVQCLEFKAKTDNYTRNRVV
ncbi:CNBP [Mytilus coruscus]|uniref:CNBP n=1 Tax=Mytilus coruscus TaxID=42192 RepID=A0A6J8B7Y7_MYTCO|nr:CNBP [Mytilus coruscus]